MMQRFTVSAASVSGYLRRNTRQIVLISFAGVGAAAAIFYARRQYQAITNTLDRERVRGSDNLRALYLASKSTADTTLRALLRPGRERLLACEGANPDPLVILLRSNINGAEKKDIWERLKVCAIVRLIVSIYYAVLVYVILLVQVNLVARYSTSNVDAPIQDLSNGTLTLESKQQFLAITRRRLFDEGGIDNLVRLVTEATKEIVGPVLLSEKVGPGDVRILLRQICQKLESRDSLSSDTVCDPVDVGDILSAQWLLKPANDVSLDTNVLQLVDESLDVCDALGYSVLVRECVDTLVDTSGALVDGHLWGPSPCMEDKKVAFAPVIAKIANVSRQVLEIDIEVDRQISSELEDTNDGGSSPDGPFVNALIHAPACQAFGAAVFLSGEREGGSNTLD
jgi:Peroxin-3